MRTKKSKAKATRSPSKPAAFEDADSPKQRLLEAATRLFCKEGINATGVDAIVAEAGTAKTTLYKLFGSKTKLVHAVLETEGRQFREWFLGAADAGGGSAETKILRMFSALKQWFGETDFYGCPFINAVGEHDKGDKQLRTLTLRHKKIILGYLEERGEEMGVADTGAFSHQIALLIDGAIVAAMVSGDPRVADNARIGAEALLAKHGAASRKVARSGKKLEAA